MPIFDQGYQHWQGQLSGQSHRWLAIVRHGVRVQMKNRLVRILLMLAWLPALGLVAAVAIWGLVEQRSEGATALLQFFNVPSEILRDPIANRSTFWTLAYSFFFQAEMFFIMLLVVVAGPGLISRDLRFNALPLYLSRPLTRFDYFLGKLGIIGTLVAAIAVLPAVIAYFIGIFFSLDLSVVKGTYHVLLASIAYGLVITLSVGTLILALSSLSRRSMYIGITWAGIWIVSWPIGLMLTEWNRESARVGVHDREMERWTAENPPPPGVQMNGNHPVVEWQAGGRPKLVGVKPEESAAAERWYRAHINAEQAAWSQAREDSQDELRKNWGPLCSYVSNLERIAEVLLDTDAAWVRIGKAEAGVQQMFAPPGRGGHACASPEEAERHLANQHVFQYPWIWSAAVLATLMGLSAWTLTRRIKSLDRLK